ncbi:MAG: RNA-directed DNA polymerase [Bacilli bacterium]|nr:RNA-directed DNA polymerase [Bacilli bacterium]
MKRLNNLYDECCKLENIIDMTELVLKRVRNKKKVNKFESRKMEHIINIKKRLESKDFRFDKYNIFMISDPKARIVMSQNIEDKIINHLIAKYVLVKVFEPIYPDCMVATRKNKGTSYGIKLLLKYLNNLKESNFYVLKLDISKYFYNIDHDVLKGMLRKKIKDKDSINILDSIIDSTNYGYVNKKIIKLKNEKISCLNSFNKNKEINEIPLYKYNKGVGLGDQTSQSFGLIYLSEFTRFLKQKLNLKYVINYMDDFVILHESKNYLKKCLDLIIDKLNEYKLELNKKKTKIDSIKNGIDFLGYRFYINNKIIIKLRNRTKLNFKKKVNSLKLLKNNNYFDNKTYYNLLSSYKGLTKYCSKLYRCNVC